eukprot:COSAG02_NODE_2063_length_9965_cov_116.411920_13_plen_375_part_01
MDTADPADLALLGRATEELLSDTQTARRLAQMCERLRAHSTRPPAVQGTPSAPFGFASAVHSHTTAPISSSKELVMMAVPVQPEPILQRDMPVNSVPAVVLSAEDQVAQSAETVRTKQPDSDPRWVLALEPEPEPERGGGRVAVGVKERSRQDRERRPLLQFVFTHSSSSSDEENVDDEIAPPDEWRRLPYESGFTSPLPRALAATARSTDPMSPRASLVDPLDDRDDVTQSPRRHSDSRSPGSRPRSRSPRSPRRVRAPLDARARARRADILAQIRGLYSNYAPEVTAEQVDEIILRWDGREEALLKQVSAKYDNGFTSPLPRALAATARSTDPMSPRASLVDDRDDVTQSPRRHSDSRSPGSRPRSRSPRSPR